MVNRKIVYKQLGGRLNISFLFSTKYITMFLVILLIDKFADASNVPAVSSASSTTVTINTNALNYTKLTTDPGLKINVTSNNANESSIAGYIANKDGQNLPVSPEKEKLSEYTGVPGTAPRGNTITAAGSAVEEVPSGADAFLFFTQTLSNGFYYEGRLYGKYNMLTQNPVFPSIPASSEDNPLGYKGVVKLGYNFHVTNVLDITPYLRLEAGQDYGAVYSDTQGNTIHSQLLAFLPGFKQTFNLTHNFVPYIDIYGGYQQISLTGNFKQGSNANKNSYGTINQLAITTELGFAYVVSEHLAVIPYTQFAYIGNNPNAVAAAPYANGGFNVSQLTGYQPMAAIKLSYAW